ncbi:hypothetical protein [Pedobacter terrae]|uniref:hypothetical protein n=1 Tax=Pedobacter terrae TaxID=405671 RepID=UPI002FF6B033
MVNREAVKQSLGSFTEGFQQSESNRLFYVADNYPDDIKGISYNIDYKRIAAGYEYRRNVMALTGGSYASMVNLEQTGYKDYIPVQDDRLNQPQYQNIRVIKSNSNTKYLQIYAVFIDLKEPYDNKQLALVLNSRDGFNGDEANALPVMDDKAAVTCLLALLQPL